MATGPAGGADTAEHRRLAQAAGGDSGQPGQPGGSWRSWGPWVAERAWGTVREDYSPGGDAWDYLPHDAARYTAYRWNEDGLAGICDDRQLLTLTLALWNGADPILKERIFGLTNGQGNHGEDAKELWWYADATPTASWLSWRYHYPVQAFPYGELIAANAGRSRTEAEYELTDTGVLDAGYWDVALDVAKAAPDDLLLRYRVTNRSPAEATLHLLPTVTFRNRWQWVAPAAPGTAARPVAEAAGTAGDRVIALHQPDLGDWVLVSDGSPELLFCDNETNASRRWGGPGVADSAADSAAFPKDGIGDHVISGSPTVNPALRGTKAAFWHRLSVAPGETAEVRLRLRRGGTPGGLGADFQAVMTQRAAEADEFHAAIAGQLGETDRRIARQALAGLLWSCSFYHYDLSLWLDGDPGQPPPPPGRGGVRNGGWRHVRAHDVLTLPDPWEYPWFAAWDLAFQCAALAHVDAEFAKGQLLLLCREWYLHPNGQLPAYEWNFSDVNPPVHAWAALHVFAVDGGGDYEFLARMLHKLLLNFTWWVNSIDNEGNNLFEGGFLGLDNIAPFDRSHLPAGAELEQVDGTAWMAMYCLDLLQMSLLLSRHDPAYADIAVKFAEHFTVIVAALNDRLWNDEDGFYYDLLHRADGSEEPVRVRSVAGLIPLAAARTVSAETLASVPGFAARLGDFRTKRPDLAGVGHCLIDGADGSLLLTAVPPDRLRRVLAAVLDPAEFLSPHGIRSLSRRHADRPLVMDLGGGRLSDPVRYNPAESDTGLFGGNSNWRGPVWVPVNRLLIGGLRRTGAFLGDALTVPAPGGSGGAGGAGGGAAVPLTAVADDLAARLVGLLRPGPDGRIPAAGKDAWPDGLLLFHEYFDGDTGRGLGASHQTGWTALLADLLLRRAAAPPS